MKLANLIVTSTLSLALGAGICLNAHAAGKAKAKARVKAKIKQHSPLASVATFKKWNHKTQTAYIKEIQETIYAFEKSASRHYQFSDSRGLFQPWMSLLPEAFAAGGQYCLIGGYQRRLVGGKCPTWGRTCSGDGVSDGGFMCGKIWGNICVNRMVNGQLDISDRCRDKFNSMSPPPSVDYAAAKADFDEIYENCAPDARTLVYDDRFQGNCNDFVARLDVIRGTAGPTPASTGDAASAGDTEINAVQLPKVGADGTLQPVDVAGLGDDSGSSPDAGPDSDPAPIPATRTHTNNNTTVASVTTTATSCADKYKTLGPLACVACGMEESAELKDDLSGQGKDLFKWISLLGTMAQAYQGKFVLNDEASRKQYQSVVMNMVASYGYCTDNEFKTNDFDNNFPSINAWMRAEPNPLYGADNAKSPATLLFSSIYGLSPKAQDHPMRYAKILFSEPKGRFKMENVPALQWRFKSMLTKHIHEFGDSKGFGTCAKGVLRRMNEPHLFQMCGLRGKEYLRNGKTEYNQCTIKQRQPKGYTCEEGPIFNYIKKVEEGQLFKNESVYNKMAASCGLPPATYKKMTCPTQCIEISHIIYNANQNDQPCEGPPEPPSTHDDPGCTSNCGGENPEVHTDRDTPAVTEQPEDSSSRGGESPEAGNVR